MTDAGAAEVRELAKPDDDDDAAGVVDDAAEVVVEYTEIEVDDAVVVDGAGVVYDAVVGYTYADEDGTEVVVDGAEVVDGA